MDSKLPYSFPYSSPVAQISQPDSVQPDKDLGLSLLVTEGIQPLTEWSPTIFSEVDLKFPLTGLHAVKCSL